MLKPPGNFSSAMKSEKLLYLGIALFSGDNQLLSAKEWALLIQEAVLKECQQRRFNMTTHDVIVTPLPSEHASQFNPEFKET